MLKRLIICLFFSLIASSASIVSASVDLERAKALTAQWQTQKHSATGVYESGEAVFVLVTRPWDQGRLNEHRKWAEFARTKAIQQWVIGQPSLSKIEQAFLKVAPLTLGVKGHQIFSGKKDNRFEDVFAFYRDELSSVTSPSFLKKEAKEGARKVLEAPENYLEVWEELDCSSFSLLLALKNYKGHLYSIFSPISAPRAFSEQASAFFAARDAYIELLPPTIKDQELYKASWQCAEHSSVFKEELRKKNIPVIQKISHRPLMRQILNCQGFVIMDETLSSDSPQMMPYIKGLFSEGKNLELATYLLECAVEESPRNVEVWEYLTAAYEASGQVDMAELTTRIWFLLDKTRNKEVLFKVLERDLSENASLKNYFSEIEY